MNCMMLHGLGQTASSWDKTAAGMQDGFTVIQCEFTQFQAILGSEQGE